MKGTGVASGLLIGLLGVAACSSGSSDDPGDLGSTSSAPEPTTRTAEPTTSAPESSSAGPEKPGRPHVVGIVATGLQAPWGVAFLPDGTALVGERDTTRVVAIKHKQVRTVGHVSGVHPQGEAGLLGLAVSPSYTKDRLVFAYLST